jgi:hypothetical protein
MTFLKMVMKFVSIEMIVESLKQSINQHSLVQLIRLNND